MGDYRRLDLSGRLVVGTAVYVLAVAIGSLAPLYWEASHYYGMWVFDFDLLKSGNLFMIAVVIAVASLGDLLYSFLIRGVFQVFPPWLVGFLAVGQFLVVAACVQKYSAATQPVGDSIAGALHKESVAHYSYLMYALAVVLGWSTLTLRTCEDEFEMLNAPGAVAEEDS